MSQNKNTILISKLRLIIAATLLFVFYISFSQNNKTNVNAFTLDIKGGVNLPSGDFKDYAKNGFQAGVALNKSVYKNLGLGVSANYNHFGLKNSFESPDNAWSSVSLAVGPQYTLPLNMFFIQLYGHIGMSLIKAPGTTKDADNIPDYFEKFDEGFFNTFKMESESTTGFHTDIGVKIGAQLSKRLSVFVGSTYTTSLNSPIEYNSRDISKAFHPSGEVDTEMIRTTPFEEKSLAFTSLNVNAGITINLGKTSNATPVQDYNSSRSNKPRPVREKDVAIDNDSLPIPVQDYNSSRSNKPRPIAWSNEVIENDTVIKPAQDYNSSRSNKPSPVREIDDVIGNDSLPIPVQDYNSSRSNKPRPIAWSNEVIENDTVTRPAQDYNSSRSNKPSPIKEINNSNGNDTVPKHVKDYNASRKDYDAKRPKEPRSVTPPDSGTENDSMPRPVQDYNSSRSNKPRPARDIDDIIINDSLPIPVQDYNSSRSNKPRPIRRIDDIDDIDNDEGGVVVIGKLTAINLKARSFELMDKKGRKISGKFQPKVTNEEVKNLRDQFLNKEANIHVKINKTKLETGKIVISYEL